MKIENEDVISGIYELEVDDRQEFRWCMPVAKIKLPPLTTQYLFIELFSNFEDFSQKTELYINETLIKTIALTKGWGTYVLPLKKNILHHFIKKVTQQQEPTNNILTLKTNKTIIAENDARTLCVRIGEIELSDSLDNPKINITANKILNNQEFYAGTTVLKSYPPSLSIDISGVCNYRPQCVFCEYDFAKVLEGPNAAIPFTKATLDEMGPFFRYADNIINCSIGEPFLAKDIGSILNEFGKEHKVVTFATNGSLLTKPIRQMLIGKKITLHISLDAATSETYAKLRNKLFPQVIDNIRKLIEERKENPWPRVFLVFMPMRANLHELEDFAKLCAKLGVDFMVIRPLNEIANTNAPDKRGGYIFYYDKELLSFNELLKVSKKATAYAQQYRVKLINQLEFGDVLNSELKKEEDHQKSVKEENREKVQQEVKKIDLQIKKTYITDIPQKNPPPICREPWETYLILRGGIKPCCYGQRHIGEMSEFKECWNGKEVQNIRKHLAEGKFSDYCLKSKSCPLIRKHFANHKK